MKQTEQCLLILTILTVMLVAYQFPCSGAEKTCDEWMAKAVSVQGSVQMLRKGETQWVPIKLDELFCHGDMIRVQERSRAAVIMRNGTLLRLDQMTTITFTGIDEEKTFLLSLIKGAVHFISRFPRSLKVLTPFVNAAVEGTEFFIRVDGDQTFLSVFEGQLAATNEEGDITLLRGQSAVAKSGKAPALHIVVRPRDAVEWALYYPPILDYRPIDFSGGTETDWQQSVRDSIGFYWKGDLANAFASIQKLPEDIQDPRFFTYRAMLLLSVGRVDEASIDIQKALDLNSLHSHAFSLQSIIAVAQNKNERALELAAKAVDLDNESSSARVALSYAQQANFDLKNSLASLQEAVKLAPENALAWSRLAELWLSVGNLSRAVYAAQKAVALNPYLGRTQTIMGFSYLAQIRIQDAKSAFKKAIELDQAAPLPRLGLGLVKIWEGDLKAGRMEIEIAASLYPNNSLIRSYLGKAYFEEKRDKLAMDQFALAKALDPLDPTPLFYDAIRKQTLNQPVEALKDLQQSIQLNENRAIYRSRLLLDADLAARSASCARIYDDLGFQQLALVEGWKSLNIDPSNYSTHRFLADLYLSQPRHEVARISELLQSQLLQPINITPVQPQFAESELFIVEGAGPADPSFNEFSQLFNRNRFAFQVNSIAGEKGTLGDELVHSGVWGRMSYSLGQFHYKTQGFRENSDLEQNIYNAFTQVSLSYKTSVQAEFRNTDQERGDLQLRFDRDNFLSTRRQQERTKSFRLGFHHSFSHHSDLIASVIYKRAEIDTHVYPMFDHEMVDDGYMGELRHLFSAERFHLSIGIGYFDADRNEVVSFFQHPAPMGEIGIRHTNLYIYSHINYPKRLTWTIGGSGDFIKTETEDHDQFNPKFGLTWNPFINTTLRAAVFRVLKKTLISKQTLEPTQVAGFNQFFDDAQGTRAWRYGIGIDQKLLRAVYFGYEFSVRNLDVPFEDPIGVKEVDWEEKLDRAYLYWTPQKWLALSLEYQLERFKRALDGLGPEDLLEIKTHRAPFGISLFHSLGLSARLKATYINQSGQFRDQRSFRKVFKPKEDQFWIVDAYLRYRFPKRWGFITIEGKNIFNQSFNYQDMDISHPVIYPERLILARFTLVF